MMMRLNLVSSPTGYQKKRRMHARFSRPMNSMSLTTKHDFWLFFIGKQFEDYRTLARDYKQDEKYS